MHTSTQRETKEYEFTTKILSYFATIIEYVYYRIKTVDLSKWLTDHEK